MSVTMDGIYVDGQKAKFRPEDILEGDASAYTEEIGESVTAWLDENVTGGETLVVDNTLTISGAAADAKVTGDEIGALKEDFEHKFEEENSLNLLDANAFVAGAPNWQTGIIEESSSYMTSPFVKVTPSTSYVLSAIYNSAFVSMSVSSAWVYKYDSIKNYIGRETGFGYSTTQAVPYTVPSGCKYIRFVLGNSAYAQYKSSMMLTAGNTLPTEYVAYNHVNLLKDSDYVRIGTLSALYQGKTISIIGDSLSDKANSTAATRYYDIVDQRLGTVSTEYAQSGCGYKRKYNNGNAFYEQALQIDSDTDLVLIFGSFNDHNVYDTDGLGDVTDTTTDTVFGCVYTTLQNVFATAPKALVGIILPTPWSQYPPYATGTLQWDYVNGIKDIAKRYSIPVLDLYSESNMRPWDATFRENFYKENDVQDSGTHPSSAGHARFAPKVVSFVESILSQSI